MNPLLRKTTIKLGSFSEFLSESNFIVNIKLKIMKKVDSVEMHDTLVAIGIVLGFIAVMVALAFLAGM